MITIYDLLRQRCGLSQIEAAAFHDVNINTVKSWCSGRSAAPLGVLEELAELYTKINNAAEQTLRHLSGAQVDATSTGNPIDVIEIGVAVDDAEAQSIGWPCVGAQRAYLGLVLSTGLLKHWRFRVAPRGANSATAAAADAHDVRLNKN